MTRPLKILHLTASLAVGGGERIVLELAQNTSKDLFLSQVCAFGHFDRHTLLTEFQKLGTAFHIVPTRKFYNLALIRAIMSHIREQQIDIIHTHLVDADIIGGFLGQILKIPVITTLQNDPQNYSYQRIDRRIITRIIARYATTHLVAVSEYIRQLFIEKWHIPAKKISAIHNSIVLDRFLAIPLGTTADHVLTVTNIASLTPQKAQHLLLDAAKIVLEAMPHVRFMIVGRGRQEQALKEYTQTIGIANQVVFTGLRHDIPDILAQSDIFVLSSLWEGLPVAAIEAMAAARAVILTDVGGNSELIESGRQGIIVPPGDAVALARGVMRLLSDESTRLAMGQAARAQAKQAFSIETLLKQYEKVYQTVWQQYHGQIALTNIVEETI